MSGAYASDHTFRVWSFLAVVLTGLISVACSVDAEPEDEGTVPLPTEPVPIVDNVAVRDGMIELGVWPLRAPDQTPADAIEQSEASAGREVDVVRLDYRWDQPFPDRTAARLIEEGKRLHVNVQTILRDGTAINWAEAAEADEGALWAQRQRWVNALGTFAGELEITIAAAPSSDGGSGEPDDFVALWRRMTTDLRVQRPEVVMTWIIDAGNNSPDIWYPGDDVVSRIGLEALNQFGCRGGTNEWIAPQQLLSPLLVLGARYPGKKLIIAAAGSVEDPDNETRKAAWLQDLSQTVRGVGYQQLVSVVFADGVSPEFPACDWSLRSSGSARDAFGSVATIEQFGGAVAAPATVRCPTRRTVTGNRVDMAAVDVDGDDVADLTFGAAETVVGVGEQGADGRSQRVLLSFEDVEFVLADGERVELRVRLIEPGPVAAGAVRLAALRDPDVAALDAYAASAQIVDEQLLSEGALPGWYEVDVTEFALRPGGTMFRLETTEPPVLNGSLAAWTVAMADAPAPADRPTLIVRGC